MKFSLNKITKYSLILIVVLFTINSTSRKLKSKKSSSLKHVFDKIGVNCRVTQDCITGENNSLICDEETHKCKETSDAPLENSFALGNNFGKPCRTTDDCDSWTIHLRLILHGRILQKSKNL